jgi:predicted MFS family arabinose efflux permease
MSLFTGVMDLGAVLGTPLCGAVAEVAGYRAMFAAMAVSAILGLALMARDPHREDRVARV